MEKQFTFDVSDLRNKSLGATISYSFDTKTNMDEVDLEQNVKGELNLMAVEEGILVQIENLETKAKLKCDKCLDNYQYQVKISKIERVFFYQKPEKIEDPNDIYFIDMKKLQIDITELLRQEIILQFPLISVCSKSCEGICPKCGKNRNKQKCNCKIVEHKPEKYYPLAKLKDLLK
ncbi:DUF177 domain-containing protein [Patescibacteria group bacterium]